MKKRISYVFVLLLGIAACGTPPVSVPEAPTRTPDPISAFLSFSSANCCKAKTVKAGEYKLPAWLDIPLQMEVGEGWRH